jgi:hypothetical protein
MITGLIFKRAEGLVFSWLIGKSNEGLVLEETVLNPQEVERLWDWWFGGSVQRSNRIRLALKSRSLAYRRAGVKSSAELACRDLVNALPPITRPKPPAPRPHKTL